jgi:hypothetical protein
MQIGGSTELRHKHAAGDIDEMDRHHTGLCGHLRPFADASDMARPAQTDRGQSRRPAFLDPDLHRLRRDCLAKPELPVENGQRRRIHNALHHLVRDQQAILLPFHVARHARDAVAVMAREIGAHQIFADARAFRRGAADADKYLGDEMFQFCSVDIRHQDPGIAASCGMTTSFQLFGGCFSLP